MVQNIQNTANKFSKENGYDIAIKQDKKFNGSIVFCAEYNDDVIRYTGYPLFIIFDNFSPRFMSHDETMDFMGIHDVPAGFLQTDEDLINV